MILVLLGTQKNDFSRLLKKIDEEIKKEIIKDEVVVQIGHTKYESDKMMCFDFISEEELNKYISKADLIISHGGVGSITLALKQNKKIIAVARLKEYGEHVNNHQIQIIESFDSNGYLKGVIDMKDFESTLKSMEDFTPNAFVSSNEKIIEIVSNFIDNN